MTGIARPMTENISIRRPFFYRDKRMVLSFLMSIPLACFGYFFEAIFMHFATGVLIDWWYFEFKGVKESEITPQGWLEKVGMSRESLDHHSTVYMWLRHGAFFVSCMAIVADMYFKFGIGYDSAFCSMYFTFRVLSFFYTFGENTAYPWLWIEPQIQWMKTEISTYPMDFNKGIDLTDPSNPIGFFHPSSPRYVMKNED